MSGKKHDEKSLVMKIFTNVMKSTADHETCMTKKENCQEQFSASKKTSEATKKRMLELLTAVAKAKDKKKALKEFKAEVEKIKKQTMNSPEGVALRECALNKCQTTLVKMFKNLVLTYNYDCENKKDQKACDRYAKAMDILNKKSISMDDYIKMLDIMVSGV